MGKRNPNPNLAKLHRNYTVAEVCELYGIHENTVRGWIKAGLPVCDDQRPILILGKDLRAFLIDRRKSNKRPTMPGEIFCLGCRMSQRPAGGMADYEPMNENLGRLVGICPNCEGMLYRRVNPANLGQVQGDLAVTLPWALRHIVEREQPPVNSDLKQET